MVQAICISCIVHTVQPHLGVVAIDDGRQRHDDPVPVIYDLCACRVQEADNRDRALLNLNERPNSKHSRVLTPETLKSPAPMAGWNLNVGWAPCSRGWPFSLQPVDCDTRW
jgi:hypothetical protein